jgi:pimeloyl-ACP methyl ester carboxylesterase
MKKTVSLAFSMALLCGILFGCPQWRSGRGNLSNASWIVAGPFDNPQDPALSSPGLYRDYLNEIGGERNASLVSGTVVGGRPCHKVKADSGRIDFKKFLTPEENVVAYAYLDLDSRGGDYVLRMGSDDGIRVWLNGRLILDHNVYRSLNADDEAVPVALEKGKNRLLVKVAQGTGEWGMTCRLLSRTEEEAAFGKLSHAGLEIVPAGAAISSGDILYSVTTSPLFGVSIPVSCVLSDSSGKDVARVSGLTNEILSVSPPTGAQGVFTLAATPASDAPAALAGKISGARAESLFIRGDAEKTFLETASEARAAARKLASEGRGDDGSDLVPTLEFLADRVEGKLHPALETAERKIQAVGFIHDILAMLRAGVKDSLRGYRQLAYRSAVDDSLQPYSLYVPRGFDPSRKYGLVVSLHGYSGDDYGGGINLAKLAPQDFIILAPFGRGDMFYRSVGEQDVLDVMDRVMARYPVDPDRVYLTGNSMGGHGTYRIGEMYPDRFAAIVPFCGWTGRDFLQNLRNLPALVIHGDSDPTVSVNMDRVAVQQLKKLGFTVRYDELKGVNHDAWGGWIRTHSAASIFDYFRSHTRNPSPDRVTAAIPYPRYGRQYWVTVTELSSVSGPLSVPGGEATAASANVQPELPASAAVDARRESKTSIVLTTDKVSALTVALDLAGLERSGDRTITLDGTRIAAPSGASSVSFVRTGGTWMIDEKRPSSGVVRHSGGGIADLFTGPLIIVYGTRNPVRIVDLEHAAKRLADWTPTTDIAIGMKTGRFMVKADTELSPTDLAAHNLLLIGNENENAVTRLAAAAIRPFYSNGVISVGGKSFAGQGLAVTVPNPFAPRFLLGYIDVPQALLPDSRSIESWFLFFPFRVRNNEIGEAGDYPGFCPDVMVLTSHPIKDAWEGWFDRNWENLVSASETP